MLTRTVRYKDGSVGEFRAPSEEGIREMMLLEDWIQSTGMQRAVLPGTIGVNYSYGRPSWGSSPARAATATRATTATFALARREGCDPFFHQRVGESIPAFARRLCRWNREPADVAREIDLRMVFVQFLSGDYAGEARGTYHTIHDVCQIETWQRSPEAILGTAAHELAHALGVDGEPEARAFANAWVEQYFSPEVN